MPLPSEADVVVVGFGVAGAAAALAAARAGARVRVLDRGVPAARRPALSRSARSRRSLRLGLRRAALAAGVAVHSRCRVHELMVDAGRVRGVGYAALPPGGGAATAPRSLRHTGARAAASVAPALARAADAVWHAEAVVGEIGCSSVVLALDPRHWEFVGPAVWSAARARGAWQEGAAPLRAVPRGSPDVRPSPELTVRTWCAAREAGAVAASRQTELGFDGPTGAVLMGDGGLPVPGLYTAVGAHRPDGAGGGHAARLAAELAAAQRAGHGAVLEMTRRRGAGLWSAV
ncbi:FAD-dependent oxidoreductase [Spirillospora sp. CA-255316]